MDFARSSIPRDSIIKIKHFFLHFVNLNLPIFFLLKPAISITVVVPKNSNLEMGDDDSLNCRMF